MDKPDKQRVGLQKKVSSLFNGVPIPGGQRAGEPYRAPVPNHDAVSPDTMPDGGRPSSGPEAEKAPQPEVLADQTNPNRQEAAAPEPSISTGVKICQNPDVVTPEPSGESQRTDVSEPTVHYSPETSAEPETVQSPAAENSDPVDNPADRATPETVSDSAPCASTDRPTAQSSLIKKLAQTEEPEDQDIPNKAGDSAPQVSTGRQTSNSPIMRKLAQTEGPADEAIPERVTNSQEPASTNRQTSQNRTLMNAREPETPAEPNAQARHPMPDSFVDLGDEGGLLQQIKEKLFPSNEDGSGAKDKVMVMLVPILAIVMIFTFRQVLHKSPGKARGAEKKDKKVVAAVISSDEIEWKIPDPLPAMTRDPLKLPEQSDTENPGQNATPDPGQETMTGQTTANALRVRDIVYSEDKASALIGEQIVHVGSKVNGITIIKINRDSVELERNGETWVQKVRE